MRLSRPVCLFVSKVGPNSKLWTGLVKFSEFWGENKTGQHLGSDQMRIKVWIVRG